MAQTAFHRQSARSAFILAFGLLQNGIPWVIPTRRVERPTVFRLPFWYRVYIFVFRNVQQVRKSVAIVWPVSLKNGFWEKVEASRVLYLNSIAQSRAYPEYMPFIFYGRLVPILFATDFLQQSAKIIVPPE